MPKLQFACKSVTDSRILMSTEGELNMDWDQYGLKEGLLTDSLHTPLPWVKPGTNKHLDHGKNAFSKYSLTPNP